MRTLFVFFVLVFVLFCACSIVLTGNPLSWISRIDCILGTGDFGICLLSGTIMCRSHLRPVTVRTLKDINTWVMSPDDKSCRETIIPALVDLRGIETLDGTIYLGQPGYPMIVLHEDEIEIIVTQ